MPTWQGHLAAWVARALVKRRVPEPPDVDRIRARFRRVRRFRERVPPDMTIQVVDAGGAPAERIRCVHGADEGAPVVLYLHGGGYFFCSPRTHRPITTGVARRTRGCVVALDYRLAPEHPFPAALHDALAAIRWLSAQGISPDRIILAGDSAGGGLAVATAMALRDAGDPLPAAILCFSPWTDLSCCGGSLETNDHRCAMLYAESVRRCAPLYVSGADPRDPLISPVYGELHDLPPILVHVSNCEVLLDDSLRLAARARAHGVEVELKVWDRLPHVWQMADRLVPEATRSLDEAVAFAAARAASTAARRSGSLSGGLASGVSGAE